METLPKTPVDIVQEFLALHSTRKEAAEKLADGQKEAASKLEAALRQSDGFIAGLMEELSNYGDAVMASADRENAYQARWKTALGALDGMLAQTRLQTFEELEGELKKIYSTTLETETGLPESLRTLLTEQSKQLG